MYSTHAYCVLADGCIENAIEECDEYSAEVPLSKQFETQVFEEYCRYA